MSLKFNGDSITFSDNSTLASASGLGGGGSNIPEPSADGLFLVDGTDGVNNVWQTTSYVNTDNSIDMMLFQKVENSSKLVVQKIIDGNYAGGIEISSIGIAFPDTTFQNTAAGSKIVVQTNNMVWDYDGNLTSGTLDLTQGNLGTVAGVYEGTLVLHGSSIGNHGLIHTLNGCEIIYDDAGDGFHLLDNPSWNLNSGSIKYQFIIKINNPASFGLSLTPDIAPGADPSDTITFKTGSFIVLRLVNGHNIV